MSKDYLAYKNKIIRSSDAEFSFLGLTGFYFYLFLIGAGIGFTLLMLLGITNVNFLIMIGVPISIIIGSYYISKNMTKKYGKAGYSSIVDSNVPTQITIRGNSNVYDKLK